MKQQITKFQHYVPQHYLRLWSTSTGCIEVYLHDLSSLDGNSVARSTKRILGGEFYYEKNLNSPDNLIEDNLSAIENDAAPVFKSINALQAKIGQEQKCLSAAKILSDATSHKAFIDFLSSQLVRTPNIIANVTEAIEASSLSAHEKKSLLSQTKPDAFITLGMKLLPTRLGEYSIIFLNTESDTFVTSDHPVAEVCTDPTALPQPVFNILHKDDTLLFFPIGPNFACILLPPSSSKVVEAMRRSANFWGPESGVSKQFGWRKTDKKQLGIFRVLYTGFGRHWLISCCDETMLISTSQLHKGKNSGAPSGKF